mgnify:CR=1 FL=1
MYRGDLFFEVRGRLLCQFAPDATEMIRRNQQEGGQVFQSDGIDDLGILFTQFHITLTRRLAVEIKQPHEYHIKQRFVLVKQRRGKKFLECL